MKCVAAAVAVVGVRGNGQPQAAEGSAWRGYRCGAMADIRLGEMVQRNGMADDDITVFFQKAFNPGKPEASSPFAAVLNMCRKE